MSEQTFIEQNCTIEHEGKSFSSGGAYLGLDKKGKLRGILYRHKDQTIGDWHNSWNVPYVILNEWISNMGDKRRLISFYYQNKRFHGIHYSVEWSDIVRVHEL